MLHSLPRKTRLLTGLLCSAALTLALGIRAAPAWAVPTVQILKIEATSDSDWAPPTHFGLGPSTPGATDDVHYINKADCKAILAASNPRVKVSWTWVPSQILGTTYTGISKVAPRGKSCVETALQESDSGSSCIVNAEVSYQLGKTYTFDVNLGALLGSGTTCNENTEQDAFFYLLVNDQASVGVNQAVVAFKSRVTVDLAGPTPPTISSLTPGGENLRVVWTHPDPDAVSGSYIYWAEMAFDASSVQSGAVKVSKSDKLTSTSHQIGGLSNGKTYHVAVVALDNHDNESVLSAALTGSPIEVLDGWQYYKDSGGTEEGGFAPCSAAPTAAPAGWWLGFLAVALLVAVRRRTRRSALPAMAGTRARGVAVAALTGVAVALASLAAGPAEAASPLTGSMDFRATRYQPGIDNAFTATAKPYADVFADPTWQFGVTYDSRLWDRFGTLSAGIGFNYWTQDGKSLVKASGESSGDTTSLQIMPLSVDLVYRFDPLAERWGIPFVPYAKIGLLYSVWWMRNGLDEIASTTNSAGTKTEAIGATGGWHGTVGLRFLLDVLEPQAQRSFDIEMGVNHSYLFGEYQVTKVDDFGSGKSFDLSDDLVVFGIAFDL